MNVLVVNWQDRENPQAGGAEIHLHEIFGRLAAGEDRVTLLCSGFAGAEPRARLDGIDVHRTGRRYTFSFVARRYFERNLAGSGFDVIVEDLNKAPLFTPRWSATPVVALVHHLFGATAFREATFPVAAATWLLERALPRAFRDRPVIAVSESTATDLARRGFDRDAITVVPNGIDTDWYTPDEHVDRFPRPTILYLGRVKRYKRVDLLIRALEGVRRDVPDARLVVAGTGDRVSHLRALARELGLEDHVAFPGFVSDEVKRDLFRRTWVHALTSPKEGWGISNIEAAACGTPTVASDAPGLRDSVRDGETGFLVEHGDVPALVARLVDVLSSPDLRERLGRGARAFAERFSWDRSAHEVRRVLISAAGRAESARRGT